MQVQFEQSVEHICVQPSLTGPALIAIRTTTEYVVKAAVPHQGQSAQSTGSPKTD